MKIETVKPQEMKAETPKTVEDAVNSFLQEKYDDVINFLKNNREEIGEFCLQVKDSYGENDKSTPLLMMAVLIEKLL